jgi:Zn-dependent M28 family amino/carboxypeptidase
MSKKVLFIPLALLVALLALAVVPLALADEPCDVRVNNTVGKLLECVTLEGVREHQAALQAIADDNNSIRTSGTSGYDDSAQYVYDRMSAAGYNVSFQEFEFLFVGDQTPPVLEQVAPVPTPYVDGVDFATMSYSGSGDVTAPVTAVDLIVPSPVMNTSTSGCEAADFAGFPAGNIALLQRGTCTFRLKAENAAAAGASGVIIFNEGNPGRTGVIFGTLNPPLFDRSVVGTTFDLGDVLRNGVLNGPTGVTVHLKTDTLAETRSTRNVIAETTTGDPNNVIVVGAHLDSVTRGPGINDNSSGSAAILEVAEQIAKVKPRNMVRFAWWGAEEFGLIGSDYYVNNLTQGERDRIALYLNFDMIGSPNYVRFVYDGDGSAFGLAGPPGSAEIEALFASFYAVQGLAFEPTQIDFRSDYAAFFDAGIPFGGLFTGAEGAKTPAQVAIYGGTAGIQFDPCYHLACDTYNNVSLEVLDLNSDAVAFATLTYAMNTESVNEQKGKGNFQPPPGNSGDHRNDPLLK